MVSKIIMSMVEGLAEAIAPLSAGAPEAGDYRISARSAKAKFLKCDGGAYSRTTYAALYAQIGTTFGSGDGSTTFNVPDPQGRALIFAGSGSLAESFAASAVAVATDLITVQPNVDRWVTGMKVRATTMGTLPTGLALATDYFVIRVSATTIKLATTLANAVAGTAIDITGQGTGTHALTHTLAPRTMGDRGGEEAHASTVSEAASHRHMVYGNGDYGGAVVTGLGDGGSRSIMGNTNASANLTYVDVNNGVPLVENTGGSGSHNNMPPFLTVGNLFIYAGV